MIFRKARPVDGLCQSQLSSVDQSLEAERELRLVDAEKRANVLDQTAEWIRAAVARRDEQNSWQASVNQLFLGGNQ